jgi:uncharacterized membrane protein (UPF0127 family)
MKSYSLIALLFLFFAFLLSACGNKKSKNEPEVKQGRQVTLTDTVSFYHVDGTKISEVRVALADDAEERNQGLMDVNKLPSDAGMLFIFPDEAPRNFYMANTPLPLDIIFVNADHTIVRIHHSTMPFSDKQLPSDKPAKFVVETNGGYAIAHDIQEGMKIGF